MKDFHTALSERHMEIMGKFAGKEEYGSRRKVIERALELLEAIDGADVREIFEAHKVRRSLLELFNFVMVNRELIDGLVKVVLKELSVETLLEKIRECTIREFKIAQKVFIPKKRVNSFSAMTESIMFYHKYLNIIGEVHANEEQKHVFAKLNTFKSIPEIPMEILNTLLEETGYTFDLRLEERPVFDITWVPPETYPKVREQREKYLNSRREALIAKLPKVK